jgi:hypothetical protein
MTDNFPAPIFYDCRNTAALSRAAAGAAVNQRTTGGGTQTVGPTLRRIAV